MKNTWKRLLALLLALCLCVSLFPGVAFAEEPEDEPAEAEALDVPPEEEVPAEADDPDAPPADLAFVLQPEDGEFPEGESYAFSWELSFAPDRQELLREDTDENGEAGLTLVSGLPLDARAWEIGEPGTYRIRAWLGEESALSAAFTVTAAPVDPVGAGALDGPDDPRDDLDPAEEAAPLPADGEIDASSGSCGTNLRWTLDDAGTLTISGTGAMKDYTSYSSAPWHNNRSAILSAVLEPGVTSIGICAFEDCYNLTSVTIPESVTSIGNYSFLDCGSLTSVTIPESVTSIGFSAFSYCDSLISVTIPSGVTSIAEKTFYECSNLASVTIPSGVTSIENRAFYNCTSLTSVNIPSGVTSIEDYAFYNCTGLTSVNIHDISAWCRIEFGDSSSNPLSYAQKLYLNGELVTDLVIPSDVTSIVDNAFGGCSSLTSVTIPSSVTSIGDYAFRGCESLISVTISEGVTSIGERAFSDCSKLTSVTIPSGVTKIEDYVFDCCSSLTSVTIPESVTAIGDSAFRYCESLRRVTIPEGVVTIGAYAFDSCSGLTRVTLPSTVRSFGEECFASCSSLGTITLPEGVTVIPEYMFNQSGVRTIHIPASVTTVEKGAFYFCTVDVVFFGGTRAQWDALSIDYDNTPLRIARIICEGDGAQGAGSETLTMRMTEGESCTFTGKAVKPAVQVYHGSTLLTEGKDYTLTYKNNTKAYVLREGEEGFAAKSAPTVTVKGKGNYGGSASAHFVILPKDLGDEDISAPELCKVYNKKEQMLVPALKYGKTALKNKTDFTVQYPDGAVSGAYTEMGSWRILVVGKGNYTGSRTVTLRIGKALAGSFSLSKIPAQTYTGEAICPALTVKSGKTVLTEGTDYALRYTDNVEIGTATVTVLGLGDYVGSKTASFKISGYALGKAKIALGASSKLYDGTEQTNSYTVTFTRPDKTVITLTEGTDFTVAYAKNVNVGKAQMIFTGMGRFSGTVKKSFKIVQRPMSEGVTVAAIGTVPYEKGGAKGPLP